ncbi:alpha-L-fucosidase [Granulicella sp. WH15]|uniref:alpha-L-fucosidase n=1 Tax=Granulicella sp. WH15 TaxID=2602070 RepID=UPI002101EB7E|nr:alpha-L-fucosidase [Granulicella sp. WH15]
MLGIGASAALAPAAAMAQEAGAAPTGKQTDPAHETPEQRASRARRLAWWREAKFGMFIHWGLYSIIGHQEWVLESEGVPIPQYEILARHFKPKPGAAREWARLAKRAGQKYMVLTTKHHEGFCLWDTKLTDYNAMKQGPGRDLVREFVDAARAEGLRVGFYYSLMDWHHPDGAKCETDEEARKRFVAYTHGLIRELLTNYGKIDILWYDVDKPLTSAQWEAEKMNQMVFDLQPEIIVNNRNGLAGDFSTPEHKIEAAQRAWESCDTMNLGWGYQKNDTEWKSPTRIVNDLTICAQQGGNYLLNIGPKPDGSVPEESVRVLERVGQWLDVNGKAIYGTDGGASVSFGNYDNFTRKGNTLYIHVYFWPGGTPAAEWLTYYQPGTVVSVGGVKAKALSARLLKTGEPVQFTQDDIHLCLTGLPATAPDDPVTVIEVECDRPPVVDHHLIRPMWQRYKVGISS